MIHILFLLAALALTLLVFWKKRSLNAEGRDKELLYYFLKSSLEFLVPLTIVLFFYLGLLAVISIGWKDISLQSLIRLEEKLTTIHSYAKWKPSKLTVLAIFVGIYVLGLLRLPLATRQRLYSSVDTFYTWSKRAYVLIVLLCSFTLLGTQLGPVTDDVRLRIKLTRDGYAELREETEEALSEAVAVQLHTKTHDTFPSAYQIALKRPEEIGSQANLLKSHYARAKSEYGIKSSKAETALSTIEARSKSNLQTEIRMPAARTGERTVVSQSELSQISYRKVTEAKTAITNYRQKTQDRIISFLSTVDGKKLSVQGLKVVTDFMKSGVFSSWIKTYPIAEPFIDVFFKTMDEKIKSRVEQFADDATRSIVQSPESIESTINGESSKIVNQTEIKISSEMTQRADVSAGQLQEELKTIEAAKAEIDAGIQQSKDSRIETLIGQLQSSDESVRLTATQELSRSTEISQRKVNQLISIMRHGNRRWMTGSYRPPGHHCTDYEYTSIRYYAATALEGMKSQFVTDEIVREARNCKSDSITTKRVTDPGWI